MVNAENIIDKVLDKADDKAELIGSLYGILADPVGSSGLLGSPAFILERIENWKFVNPVKVLETTLWYAKNVPDKYPLRTGVAMWLIGMLGKEFGNVISPKLSKLGGAMKKIGIATAFGTLLAGQIWLPPLMNSPTPLQASMGVTNGYGY